ncbi:MAG: M20/M25/M40 family metallo-hydrolase [Vulcanimicrobiota bacterium]
MEKIFKTLKKEIYDARPLAEELLKTVVNINSHTGNRPGVNEVGQIFQKFFEDLNMSTGTNHQKEVGNILHITNPAFKQKKGGYLFLAHMDTVFPPGEDNIPFSIESGRYRGNGSCDDKGGAVIAWQALYGLKKAGLLDEIPVQVLLTTDEETGSYHSRNLIRQIASTAGLVFVVEYGKPVKNGATVVTSRLGRGVLELNLTGPQVETALLDIIENAYFLAGPDFRRMVRIKQLDKGNNSIKARIYFGFPLEPEGDYLLKALMRDVQNSISRFKVDGTVKGEKVRPPLVFERIHWEMIEKLARAADKLDFKLFHEHRVSCSDGSFVPVNVPVLDGMGPIGDNVHTPDEFMAFESLTVRPLLMASLMAELR